MKEGHENSNRNPFPEQIWEPKLVQSHSFSINFEFLRNLSLPYERYIIHQDDVKKFPVRTMQNGFYYYSPNWFYSKLSMEGLNEPLKQDGLTWLTEDEEEEFESNCSFTFQNFPPRRRGRYSRCI